MKIKLAPSILSADFGKLNEEIAEVAAHVELIHVDVMDGHFVPNITIGAPVVKKIKTDVPLDVHLMIENPEKYIKDFAEAGAAIICVHAEATDNLPKLIADIKALGVKAAVSIKPKTPLSAIESVLDDVGMVLVMSVEPGFGGQGFMPEVLPKVKELREKKPELDIQMDGGISKNTIKQAVEAGANVFVAGSAIFGQKDRAKAIQELKKAVE